VLAAELGQPERVTDLALDRRRKGEEIPLRRTDPVERLFADGETLRMEISQNGDRCKNVLVLFLA